MATVIGSEDAQAIPPEVEHEVQPLGPASFSIDFLAIEEAERPPADRGAPGCVRAAAGSEPVDDEGGDAACWAHLLCPDCGAAATDGYHFAGCPSADHPPP
jgi:hypothetical protein